MKNNKLYNEALDNYMEKRANWFKGLYNILGKGTNAAGFSTKLSKMENLVNFSKANPWKAVGTAGLGYVGARKINKKFDLI